MGRRALRTGDLVKVGHKNDACLNMYGDADLNPLTYLGEFTFGIYIAGVTTVLTKPVADLYPFIKQNGKWIRKKGDHYTISSALVLDSATCRYGWVLRPELTRIE